MPRWIGHGHRPRLGHRIGIGGGSQGGFEEPFAEEVQNRVDEGARARDRLELVVRPTLVQKRRGLGLKQGGQKLQNSYFFVEGALPITYKMI